MLEDLKHLMRDETGATAIEYALIASLISVASIGGLDAIGVSLGKMFSTVSGKIDGAVAAAGGGGASGATGGGTGGPPAGDGD